VISEKRESYYALLLIVNLLKQAIKFRVNVGILLISYHSGGWVIQLQLNITAMTVARLRQESKS